MKRGTDRSAEITTVTNRMKLPFVAHKESFPRAVIFINALHLPRPHYDELLKEFIIRFYTRRPRYFADTVCVSLFILLRLNNAKRRIVPKLSLARR